MSSTLPTILNNVTNISLSSPTPPGVFSGPHLPLSPWLSILNLFFILLGLLSFLWIVLGTPLGIIFLIIYLVGRHDPAKKKFLKLSLISLAGLPVGFILIAIASALFGLTHLIFSPNIGNLRF